MYITKQISLSLLLLTSGIVLASAEQNGHDYKIGICNGIGRRCNVTIAPKGNTGYEIEQAALRAFMGNSAAEYKAGVFTNIKKNDGSYYHLESDYRYTFEELQSLMFPGGCFGDYFAIIYAQKTE